MVSGKSTFEKANRRSVLKAAAFGALGVGVLGGSVDATETDYRNVIDVVDAGADNSGEESITPVLEDVRADDTLLKFPPGEYYMDSQFRFTGFSNFGIVGDDATVVPADYWSFEGPTYRLFRLGTDRNPGGRIRFEGITVDQRAPSTGVRVIDAAADAELRVRDVHLVGEHDSGLFGPARFSIRDPNGRGVVERFEAPDGAAWVRDTPNAGTDPWDRGPTGVFANTNRGELLFKDCVLGAFPSTGLYASGGSGQIRVEGGRYANSNVAQIRLGGSDSYVRGASIVVDDTRDPDVVQQGIRLTTGRDLRVLDSEVTISVTGPGNHALLVDDAVDSVWIEGSTIETVGDEPNTGIFVESDAGETTILQTEIDQSVPGGYGVLLRDGSASVTCQELSITGDAGDEGARCGIINYRDDAEFRAVEIDQTEGDDRIGLRNSGDDVLVYDGRYLSSYYPIVDHGTGTWVEAVHADSAGDRPAVLMAEDSADALIKESRLVDGIENQGEDLRTWGNSY